MSNPSCPTEDDLLPLLTEDTVPQGLRAHVDECAGCRGRLDRLRAEMTDLRSAPLPRAPANGSARPAVIGKYLIVGALDAGGQALVFRAVHPTLDKELVIKLSRSPLDAESDDRDLLVREGKLLASLDHPNLARVYDLDFHGNLPFLAMEYIRGRTLSKFAADFPPDPRESARLVAEVAQALAAVHRRGIIHQDIKPKNILIDDNGQARLIDFGMARLRHAWDGSEPFGGTPDFMAPEQARSEENRVTSKSDVFSLGAVMYFLLTGHAPFEAPTAAKSLERAQKCEFDRTALDRATTPRRLRDVVLRAMAPEPDGRFARADEFAVALHSAAAPIVTRRQALTILGGLSAAAFAVAAGPAIHDWIWPKPFTADFTVHVYRNGDHLNLEQAKPLNPATDRLEFIGHVPSGFHAVLFWRKSGGELETFTLEPVPGAGGATVTYPKSPNTVSLEPGPMPQTDIVFMAAAPKSKDLQQFEPLLRDALAKLKDALPALPPRNVFVWDDRRGEVRVMSPEEPDRSAGKAIKLQSPGDLRAEPTLVFKEAIERLLANLKGRIPILLPAAFSY